jgi:NAD(P)-dependent dehydrogenase (short-subunit alcohol dehydrogenase family)
LPFRGAAGYKDRVTRPSIFVTGAASGIGRATAELFAERGWFVGLYDVNEAGARELAARLGSASSVAGTLDVTDAARFAAALAQFWQAAGQRLDLLFNNAGIASIGDFEKIPLARHHAIVDVNLKGVINGCHCALQYLQRTPGARVINTCSASAIYGTPAFAGYSATKFAVKGFTEALDIEWRRHGVTVRDVLPLFVDTPLVRQGLDGLVGQPLRSIEVLGMRLTAADVAATVWRAAHWKLWPRVHWYPGRQGWFMALAQKLSPGWLSRLTTRWMSGY